MPCPSVLGEDLDTALPRLSPPYTLRASARPMLPRLLREPVPVIRVDALDRQYQYSRGRIGVQLPHRGADRLGERGARLDDHYRLIAPFDGALPPIQRHHAGQDIDAGAQPSFDQFAADALRLDNGWMSRIHEHHALIILVHIDLRRGAAACLKPICHIEPCRNPVRHILISASLLSPAMSSRHSGRGAAWSSVMATSGPRPRMSWSHSAATASCWRPCNGS